MKILLKKSILAVSMMLGTACAFAEGGKSIEMNLVDATGPVKAIGSVTVTDTAYGLVLTPNLEGLSPGLHGFHVHTNPDCGPKEVDGKVVVAGAAGGHFDPANTGKHGEPWGDGHLGDLPALYVNADGKAVTPILAPRLKVADLQGRSLMIHAGGENYSDHPAPLGGGGPRMACGVVK